MTKINFIFYLSLLITICSCSNPKIRERFNLEYATPDEFMVQKQKELVIPKKFELTAPINEENNDKTIKKGTSNLSLEDQEFLNKIKN
jgi:hypothetical protein